LDITVNRFIKAEGRVFFGKQTETAVKRYQLRIWPEKEIFEKLANHRAAFFDIAADTF